MPLLADRILVATIRSRAAFCFIISGCFAYSSTLKVEAVHASETWVIFYQTTQRYSIRHTHRVRPSNPTEIIFSHRLIISCRTLIPKLYEKRVQVAVKMGGAAIWCSPSRLQECQCNRWLLSALSIQVSAPKPGHDTSLRRFLGFTCEGRGE